jgi:hypothetical protein
MEILGRYRIREATNEKVIHAPANVWGEWILTTNNNGTFTYSPAEGQIVSPPKKGTQWIVSDSDGVDPVTFTDENKAVLHKEQMERSCGKVFRMKKVFPSNGIRTLGEPMC